MAMMIDVAAATLLYLSTSSSVLTVQVNCKKNVESSY